MLKNCIKHLFEWSVQKIKFDWFFTESCFFYLYVKLSINLIVNVVSIVKYCLIFWNRFSTRNYDKDTSVCGSYCIFSGDRLRFSNSLISLFYICFLAVNFWTFYWKKKMFTFEFSFIFNRVCCPEFSKFISKNWFLH